MSDRRLSPDDPHWGPARTYRARPGRTRSRGHDAGIPVEDISEEDLIEPGGGYVVDPGPESVQSYAQHDGYDDHDGYDEGYAYADADHAPDAPSDGAGRAARAPRTRRPRGRRRPVRWVLLLIVALIAYPFALAQTAMSSMHRVPALSNATDTPGRNFLVVGSDSRSGTDMEAVEGQRTDTIIVLHVPRSGPTVMLSLPRDSEVKIPGHGKNKINASYSIGGPKLLVETVELATGLRIDGYVETGLAGFADIVDAVGGIEICPTFDMQDEYSQLDVKAGCQQADGPVALAYARTRHADPRGDLGRVDRQREVMASIAKRAASPAVLLNPFSAFPLARAGGNALTVDEDMSMVQLGYFLIGMRDAAGGDGISLTVPIARTDRNTSHGQVVDWDEDQADVVFGALQDSSTEALRSIADDQQAAVAGD